MSSKPRHNEKLSQLDKIRRRPRRKRWSRPKSSSVKKNPDIRLSDEPPDEPDSEHYNVASPNDSTPPQARASTPLDSVTPVTPFSQPCSPIRLDQMTILSDIPSRPLEDEERQNIKMSSKPRCNEKISLLDKIRRRPRRKRWSRPKSASVKKNPDIRLSDEPPEEPDSELYNVASPNDSNPPQARASTPLDSVTPVTPFSQPCSPNGFDQISIMSDTPSRPLEDDNERFEVAEMLLVEETSECPKTSCNLKEVKAGVQLFLPSNWCLMDLNRVGENAIILIRMAECRSFLPQVQVQISEDGKVDLDVHSKSLPPHHEIWEKLPEKRSLSSDPVSEAVAYVSSVFKVVRAYEVCLGCHVPQYQAVVKKLPNVVFSPNNFKERKYDTTHRSQDCGLLVLPRFKNSVCSACYIMIRNVRKRFKRRQLNSTPKVKTANKFLYTPQYKKKLEREKRLRRNTKAREMYYRNKIENLIISEGTDIDADLNDDLSQILVKHYEAGDCSEVLDTLDTSDTSQTFGPKNISSVRRKHNELLKIFIEEQIKAVSVKRACGMRWHPLMIRLALRLHMTSPAGYRALADSGVIKLPSERTLYDYSHYDKPEAGIDGPAVLELHNLLEKSYGEDAHQRYHLLLMDEMSISKNLVYSRSSGELTGFVKLSEIENECAKLELALEISEEQADKMRPSKEKLLDYDEAQLIRQKSKELQDNGDVVPDVADKVLTFMVVGLTNGVKSVVASYGVNNQMNVESLTARVWEVIAKLERASIKILGIVCDGHPVNRKFIKRHKPSHPPLPSGTVFSTKNRVARSRDIFFISDVPHLLKTLRNCLFNSEGGKGTRYLKKNGQILSWRTIVQLFNDEKNKELRMAYKLNAQVVYLNCYSGMKVSYAARVLSATIANAIEAMGYPGCEELVKFIRLSNDFFDCLNGCSSSEAMHKRNINLAPYRSANDRRFKILRDYLNYLLEWSKEVEDPKFCISHETLTGIEMTINAFEKCCQFMFSKGAKFIMARLFCQDPLEQNFGKQRAACGGSTNPNLARFLGNQNKIRLLKNFKFKTNGNTEDVTDSGTVEDLSTPLPKRQKQISVESRVKVVRRKLASDSDFTT